MLDTGQQTAAAALATPVQHGHYRWGEPFEPSVRTMIDGAQVIMFDEFHVHDVADAVFLSRTLVAAAPSANLRSTRVVPRGVDRTLSRLALLDRAGRRTAVTARS